MAASCASEAGPRAVALRTTALALGRPGCDAPILEDVDFELEAGECVLLEGATGSGKSTLLRALAGLRGVEWRAGTLTRSERVALLLQHVETQLLCTTVGEEVALGPRHRGLSDPHVATRVRRALARVGMTGSEAHEVDTLSAGQKQRVVLAALLALEPRVLLLDEPSSALDPQARRDLAGVLAELKAGGTALLIADHAPAELGEVVDRCVRIEKGRLQQHAEASGRESSVLRGAGAPRSVSTRRGERVLVTGPNGSGKSTWLRALARRAERGSRNGRRPADVALVIQEPRRSLFARTVAEEVGFALRRRRVPAAQRRARVHELLARFELHDRADASPLRLSFGQQHRLAIAAALAPRPRLVLLDEPFAGLDPAGRNALLGLLEKEQARSGARYVLASHDRRPLADWCDRVIELPSGTAGEVPHV